MSRPPGSPLRSQSPAVTLTSTAPDAHTELSELWKKALEAYQQKTGKELVVSEFAQKIIECETAEAISDLIDQRAAAFKEYRGYGGKTKDLLKRAVPILKKFSEGGGETASSASILFLGFIIFSANNDYLRLAGAAKVSELYDIIESTLSDIEHELARFDTYLQSPPISVKLSTIFVKGLVATLSLLGLLTKYCNKTEQNHGIRHLGKIIKHRAVDYFNALLGGTEFQDNMKALRRLSEDEAKQAIAEIHRGMGQVHVGLASVQANLLTLKEGKEYDEMKKWLDAPDVEDYHHEKLRRAKASCDWIVESENFQRWIQTGDSLYSITADAGSGKSTICSLIIEALQIKSPKVALIYFYFDSTSGSRALGSRRALMSSLVFQIACSSITAREYVRKEQRLRRSLPDHRLSAMLLDLMGKLTEPLLVFIDALDECPREASERSDMMDLLNEMCALRSEHLHLLVTTRPENDILFSLAEFPSTHRFALRLQDEREHYRDIEVFVRNRLGRGQFTRWKPELREAAEKVLINPQKSQGMFLWVSLQLQQLELCPEADVEHVLEELPSGLEATYRQILSRFDPARSLLPRVRAILGFIAVSHRPLTVDEVAAAFTFDFARGEVLSADPEKDAARHYLPSLVTTVDYPQPLGGIAPPSTVHFIHFSVKEYLFSQSLRDDQTWARAYYLDPYFANTSVATLLLSVFDQSPSLDALRMYATRHWDLHIPPGVGDGFPDSFAYLPDPEARQNATTSLNKSLTAFLTPGSLSYLNLQKMRPPAFLPSGAADMTPLHWAAALALRNHTQRLLRLDSSDINRADDIDPSFPFRNGTKTPLSIVASRGSSAHFGITDDLISHGADINLRPRGGQTAIEHALQAPERDRMLQYMVSKGADVNTADPKSGRTVLHDTAGQNLVSSVHTLIELGADKEARDKEGRTALHWAAISGASEGVHILLEAGADPNPMTIHGCTTLHIAAMFGLSAAVGELLDHKADVRARVASPARIQPRLDVSSGEKIFWGTLKAGFTALHAVAYGQTTICDKFVTENDSKLDDREVRRKRCFTATGNALLGFDDAHELVNIPDSEGCTALHYSWDAELMALLLKYGASPSHADSAGRTPLHHLAAMKQSFEGMKVLLDSGADPNAVDSKGETPMHRVSWGEDLESLELLMAHGAKIHAADAEGRTPLHAAAAEESLGCVKILLSSGAKPNVADSGGLTPLHWAIRAVSKQLPLAFLDLKKALRVQDVVEALLAHGADPDIADAEGRTALHYEAMMGSESPWLRNLLLASGARLDAVDHGGATPGDLVRKVLEERERWDKKWEMEWETRVLFGSLPFELSDDDDDDDVA